MSDSYHHRTLTCWNEVLAYAKSSRLVPGDKKCLKSSPSFAKTNKLIEFATNNQNKYIHY